MSEPAVDEARALLRRSVLKQAKVAALLRFLGSTNGQRCLDIGGDNGVVSLMLRGAGGRWSSADGAREAVTSIRRVVGPQVCLLDGARLPFASASLDVVVVADYLEHVEDDRLLVGELARVLKPSGRLIVNVPHVKSRSLLRYVRDWAGLTDAWHGHVRPGYRWSDLRALLSRDFSIDAHETYSRAFSECLDIALNVAQRGMGGAQPTTMKGPIASIDLARRGSRSSTMLAAAAPIMRAFAALDHVMFPQPGYRLIVRATRLAPAAIAS